MPQFEFSLIVSGVDPEEDAFEDRFYEAGCDDALVSIVKGLVVLDFTRQEKNFVHAVDSAIKDVESTGAKVVRLEPDPFVTLSDIANRTSLSKQLISLYVQGKRGPKDFPLPSLRVSSDSPLWEWLSVARWLRKNQKIDDSMDVVHAALLNKFNNDLADAEIKQSDRSPAPSPQSPSIQRGREIRTNDDK
ncbi:MAG: hypothetical protein HQ503_10985 [Rhodospirillales bacterium]|nr:hypothetical protein [Rhodospirillales bacterium]